MTLSMDAVSSGLGTSSLWSLTPSMPLHRALPDEQKDHQANILITSGGQISQILETLAHADRNTNIYVQYSEIEAMARELLLLGIAFDREVSAEERSEMFLEIFSNVKLREKTFNYLCHVSKRMLRFIGNDCDDSLKDRIKLSNLKHRQLDELEQSIAYDTCQQDCDLETLREHRLRGYYGERYDVRTNLIDWDYVMNLKKHASIIQKQHFTEWRMLGQAFEVREAKYTIANKTLLSYRTGKKRSTMASVRVLGYWGDLIASPYLAFGIEADDRPDLFELRGDQHKHTACDVARHNVRRLLEAVVAARADVTVIPIMDLSKARFDHLFDCVLMPMQSRLQPEDVHRLIRSKGHIVIETAKFIPSLSEKNRLAYEMKIREMGRKMGWATFGENLERNGEVPVDESTMMREEMEAVVQFIAG